MNKFVITTDYTCDIYPEFFDENEIVRVVMPITIDGEEYDLENKKISSKDLYDKMRHVKLRKPINLMPLLNSMTC